MPTFTYNRERSKEECMAAKSRLKDFYRWKYGHPPPQDWTVDHQVEQAPDYYERFGPALVHDPLNMLMVPREVNVAKNIVYGRCWSSMPAGVRALAPDFLPEVRSPRDEPLVRELAFFRSEFLDDENAWFFLTDLSIAILKQVIAELEETWWKEKVPDWMVKYPKWLGRLRLDLDNHIEHYLEFERHCSRRAKLRDVRSGV